MLSFERNSMIFDWAPLRDLERKRSPFYYKASKLLPRGTIANNGVFDLTFSMLMFTPIA